MPATAYFVKPGSIVRKIWGKSDTILIIFAGAAAEFALNKAVDWLYFTGRLPADPLGRLFSTVEYARLIVFSDTQGAHHAIDRMASIHTGVETSRGAPIPDWAYRDVLFMLIAYSIAAYELLENTLTDREKEEVFNVFASVGHRMGLKDLPQNYTAWLTMRQQHLNQNMQYSHFTKDLYMQYRAHLGTVRYWLLLQVQQLVVPAQVKQLLQLSQLNWLAPLPALYKFARVVGIDKLLKAMLLPAKYKAQIAALDRAADS